MREIQSGVGRYAQKERGRLQMHVGSMLVESNNCTRRPGQDHQLPFFQVQRHRDTLGRSCWPLDTPLPQLTHEHLLRTFSFSEMAKWLC